MAKSSNKSPLPLTGRRIAARVVLRVLKGGAFAAAALAAELERAPELDDRERAFATELVYGTLRVQRALDARLLELSPRGIADAFVRTELLIAAYQLMVLDRVPDFAVVDSAVEAIRAVRGARVAGFVNAVLRKLAAGGARLDVTSAVQQNLPAWLLERIRAAVGNDEADALLVPETSPAVGLRLVGAQPIPAWLENAEHGRASPRARLVRGVGDPRRQLGYDEGAFVVQEEGAQLVGLALGARAGERILDACAGRGQKSSLLAEQIGAQGELWACDLYPAKLEALRGEFARLGLPMPRTLALDLTLPLADVPMNFDRVLVDAPCSGTGTLRRRPEIGLRLEESDPARLSLLAETILRRVAEHVRPGGRVVFAVCSVLREECEDLLARVSDVLSPAPFDAPELAGLVEPGATSFRLLPLRHGTDGYFVASFTRK